MKYVRPFCSVAALAASIAILLGSTVQSEVMAEEVVVRFRGMVNLDHFECHDVARSSFIKRVCYDRAKDYMVISLKGTYFHYCEIENGIVEALLSAESLGRLFNVEIKGRYDCRSSSTPDYD